ncbi:hypothetical protein PV08_10893 [Exophiala spinifera]|uniref:Uncharacterized protein n=1 Tax=Exophiala spinifera TaxID=91928 RepID=A0A0D1ZF47_9EURO|nr:uncharacterized protein PV08_10893 [Exophiala spinifera]KIW11592.1 hypothetical protein PV08_10893 [Exophiala spinifera]
MAQASQIVPFIILLIVVAVVAVVGFIAYSIAHDVGHHTRKKLERKNVSFTRDGMKVGVRERSAEHEQDKAQSVITKIWNHSSWPAYQSRLGWGQGNKSPATTPSGTPSVEKRNPYSRTSSSTGAASAPGLSRQGSSQAGLSRTTSATTR